MIIFLLPLHLVDRQIMPTPPTYILLKDARFYFTYRCHCDILPHYNIHMYNKYKVQLIYILLHIIIKMSTFIIFHKIEMFYFLSVLVEILTKTTPGMSPSLQFVLINIIHNSSEVSEKLSPPACSNLSTKSARRTKHHFCEED